MSPNDANATAKQYLDQYFNVMFNLLAHEHLRQYFRDLRSVNFQRGRRSGIKGILNN